MKKTLKRTGAIGLAVATIVTGLSFGPAATAAASDGALPSEAAGVRSSATVSPAEVYEGGAIPDVRFSAPFVLASATNNWFGVKATGATGATSLKTMEHTTLAAALADAGPASFPGDAEVGQVRVQTVDGVRCIQTALRDLARVTLASCSNDAAQQFKWVDEKNIYASGRGLARADAPSNLRLQGNGWPSGYWVENATFINGDVFPSEVILSARVDSTDIPNRTAQISGTAAPRAYVVIDGKDEVQADLDGRWHHQLTDLKLGSNTVTLEHYQNGEKTATTTIDAELKVAPVTGGVSFPADPDQDAVVSGTAQPGATIVIRDVHGEEVARTQARPGSGVWSTPIPAPDAGGDHDLRVHQEIDGEATGEIIVTAAYGAAVVITEPAEGTAHEGGPVTLRGTGEIDARVVVREQGSTTIIGTGDVHANGQWTMRTTDVDARGHVLEVTQAGKGGNTTRSTVTLSPEDDGVTQPFELTSPVDGSTVVAPTNQVAFTGIGTTGARVEIMNAANSRVIGSAEIGQDGTWSTAGVVGFGDQKIRAKVTTNGQVQNTYIDIRVDASEGITQPFALATPTDGETVVAPTNQVTFTGTGTTGALVEIMNASNNRVIASTIVGSDGTWSKAGLVGFGDQKIRAKVTTNGVVQNIWIDIRVEASAGVTQPFALTSPLDGTEVIAPTNTVTFTGTGTSGDTVAIINTYNGRVVASTTVDSAGNWSKAGVLGFGTQNLRATVTHQGVPTDHPFSVTVKAAAGVERPFAVTTPANGATVIAPDNQVTFSGTGTTGARVVLTTGTGRSVINTVVREDGTWSDSGLLGHQYYELATSYTPVGGTPVTGTTSLTVKASDAVINPFAITAPADGSTVVAPNNMVTFTGTGAAGATVQLINDPGGQYERVVAQAVVRPDGTWTASGGLSHQRYTLGYTHTPGAEGGTPATGTVTITVTAQ